MEYRCVYGEGSESALRFLFHAIAPKAGSAFPFQGHWLLYLDNGSGEEPRVSNGDAGVGRRLANPCARWQRWDPRDHTCQGQGRTAFRTVKEAHETLYHFHKPDTEEQANAWLCRYLLRYNEQQHRSRPMHAWPTGWPISPRKACARCVPGEQFCRLAREPERRKVGVDARVTIAGTAWGGSTARRRDCPPVRGLV